MTETKILDGGTGSEIRRRGYDVPSHIESIWSAQALIDNPEVVEQIHYDYIHAGANYITINNYALTQPILSRAKIKNKLKNKFISSEDILITRERHRQHLEQCVEHLKNFNDKKKNDYLDKGAEDLRLATRHLGMIVGKVNVEEILDSIFNDFCIGK